MDLRGVIALPLVSQSQLSIVVILPPGIDRPVFAQGNRLAIAGCDSDDVAEIRYGHRFVAGLTVADSQKSLRVVCPRHDAAVVPNRE